MGTYSIIFNDDFLGYRFFWVTPKEGDTFQFKGNSFTVHSVIGSFLYAK